METKEIKENKENTEIKEALEKAVLKYEKDRKEPEVLEVQKDEPAVQEEQPVQEESVAQTDSKEQVTPDTSEENEPMTPDDKTESESREEPKDSKDTKEPPESEKEKISEEQKKPKTKKKLKVPSVKNPSKKFLRILLAAEVIFLALLVLVFTRSVSLNRHDDIKYADDIQKDSVTVEDGILTVNNITAKVPSKGNVEYNIAYAWGKEDTDHPSVPHAAVASYSNDAGRTLFELSLYRDSFTPAEELPEGKNASNWFKDWKEQDDGNYRSEAVKDGTFNGFLITSVNSDNDSSSYSTSTFYFTTQTKKGVSVYVLEGVLYDQVASELFQKSFDYSRKSLALANKT